MHFRPAAFISVEIKESSMNNMSTLNLPAFIAALTRQPYNHQYTKYRYPKHKNRKANAFPFSFCAAHRGKRKTAPRAHFIVGIHRAFAVITFTASTVAIL